MGEKNLRFESAAYAALAMVVIELGLAGWGVISLVAISQLGLAVLLGCVSVLIAVVLIDLTDTFGRKARNERSENAMRLTRSIASLCLVSGRGVRMKVTLSVKPSNSGPLSNDDPLSGVGRQRLRSQSDVMPGSAQVDARSSRPVEELQVEQPIGATSVPQAQSQWVAKTLRVLQRWKTAADAKTRDLRRENARLKSSPPRDAEGYQRWPIPERVRHEVWRRDQGRCVDCGSRARLEFDHIIPVSQGGSNTARNLELRCEPCNRTKAAKI